MPRHKQQEPGDVRQVQLFRNGRNQAVRIPRDWELPGTSALIRKDGSRLILEPVPKLSLKELLDSWKPIDEDWPEMPRQPPRPVKLFE
jgi:antitoxin VapB